MKIKLAILCVGTLALNARSQDSAKLTEVWTPVPRVVTPGTTSAGAPSDAVQLFVTAKDTTNWISAIGKPAAWKSTDDILTVSPGKGAIRTKQGFGDCQLHIEWRTPAVVKGNGQGRGNSGIFLMGLYELQVLDSYNNPTYSNGQAGSIYKQHMPLVNACRPPGEWQTYDILFTAPVFYADGSIKTPAKITVLQNGILVQWNFELWGPMQYIGIPKYQKHSDKEPLLLQDHGDLVSYRNIWIREL